MHPGTLRIGKSQASWPTRQPIANSPLPNMNASPDSPDLEPRRATLAVAAARAAVSRRQFWKNVFADRKRHGNTFFTRSVLALIVFRFGGWALTQPRWIRFFAMKLYSILYRIARVLTGLHMHCEVLVGDSLHLIHCEGPISIHPDVVLGDRVGIMHNVTIGLTNDQAGAPILGNDVFVGTGAVILGPVTIGDNSRIAANSLVITNVPANSIAIGVPARVLPRTDVERSPLGASPARAGARNQGAASVAGSAHQQQ